MIDKDCRLWKEGKCLEYRSENPDCTGCDYVDYWSKESMTHDAVLGEVLKIIELEYKKREKRGDWFNEDICIGYNMALSELRKKILSISI